MTYFTILMAVLPSVLLVRYFIKKDVYTEPTRVIISTFLWGIVITVPLIFIEDALIQPSTTMANLMSRAMYQAFVVAAGPEEFLKYLVFALYCLRHQEFDEPMDGIVYGAVVSLGFATFENIVYVMDGGFKVALMRAFTAVPAHACFGAIMGYYIAMGHFGRMSSLRGHCTGLGAAILLHGLYDLPPFTIMNHQGFGQLSIGLAAACLVGFVVIMVVLVRKTLGHVKELRDEQLRSCKGE